jgi:hypothetical protein
LVLSVLLTSKGAAGPLCLDGNLEKANSVAKTSLLVPDNLKKKLTATCEPQQRNKAMSEPNSSFPLLSSSSCESSMWDAQLSKNDDPKQGDVLFFVDIESDIIRSLKTFGGQNFFFHNEHI